MHHRGVCTLHLLERERIGILASSASNSAGLPFTFTRAGTGCWRLKEETGKILKVKSLPCVETKALWLLTAHVSCSGLRVV